MNLIEEIARLINENERLTKRAAEMEAAGEKALDATVDIATEYNPMAKAQWKVIETRRRSACWPHVEPEPPRAVKLDLSIGELIVTRSIHYEPTTWVIQFAGRNYIVKGDKSLDEAKKAAVKFARDILHPSIDALE